MAKQKSPVKGLEYNDNIRSPLYKEGCPTCPPWAEGRGVFFTDLHLF